MSTDVIKEVAVLNWTQAVDKQTNSGMNAQDLYLSDQTSAQAYFLALSLDGGFCTMNCMLLVLNMPAFVKDQFTEVAWLLT